MADDADRAVERAEQIAEATARLVGRFKPPETRKGSCDDCGLPSEALAQVDAIHWWCPQCRDDEALRRRRRLGRA